jgi:hypothetical protein
MYLGRNDMVNVEIINDDVRQILPDDAEQYIEDVTDNDKLIELLSVTKSLVPSHESNLLIAELSYLLKDCNTVFEIKTGDAALPIR